MNRKTQKKYLFKLIILLLFLFVSASSVEATCSGVVKCLNEIVGGCGTIQVSGGGTCGDTPDPATCSNRNATLIASCRYPQCETGGCSWVWETCDDSCGAWYDQGCGGGGCLSTQKRFTRTCSIAGCSLEDCRNDVACSGPAPTPSAAPVPTPAPLPCPANLTYVCSADSTSATFSWNAVPGSNGVYSLRMDKFPYTDWYNPAAGDQTKDQNGTSTSLTITPGSFRWSIQAHRPGEVYPYSGLQCPVDGICYYPCARCSTTNGCEWTTFGSADASCVTPATAIVRSTNCACSSVPGGNNTRCSACIPTPIPSPIIPTPTPSIPTPPPTPTPSPPTPICACGVYNSVSRTTPISWSWAATQGSGLQVWDNTGVWWFNDWTNSPRTFSIPPGRMVTGQTTYDFITFSTTRSCTCPAPTPTPGTPTPPPLPTPTPAPTPPPPPPPICACGVYNSVSRTTPITWSWTPIQASGLQVWDNTGIWWFNDWTNSPRTFSIPPGRMVTGQTTYDFITFSTTRSCTCPAPTPTPGTPTPPPLPTPTPLLPTPSASPVLSTIRIRVAEVPSGAICPIPLASPMPAAVPVEISDALNNPIFNQAVNNTYTTISNIPVGQYSITDTSPPANFLHTLSCNGLFSQTTVNLTPAQLSWDLGFINNNQIAWFQAVGGNVHANANIANTVPASQYMITSSAANNNAGIVSYGQTGPDIDTIPTSANKGFLVKDATHTDLTSYYDYYDRKFENKTSLSGAVIDLMPAAGTVSDPLIYIINNSATIRGPAVWNILGVNQSLIIFVNGNLTIEKNIRVASGNFLAFIVKGNITVNGSVGYALGSIPANYTQSDVANLSGIFLSDQTFNSVQPAGITNNHLLLHGTYVANNFNLTRNLGAGNSNTPAERFVYRPDLWTNAPNELKQIDLRWQEVAP